MSSRATQLDVHVAHNADITFDVLIYSKFFAARFPPFQGLHQTYVV